MKDRLLASQNLTSEYYRKKFKKLAPDSEQSFTYYFSTMKTTLDRWQQLARVSDYQGLYELIIKNKILLSFNDNLVAFLIERVPKSLDELARFGDQFYSAHPFSKV